MKSLKILLIISTTFFLISCGPSEEEMREKIKLEQFQAAEIIKQEELQAKKELDKKVLANWQITVDTYQAMKAEKNSMVESVQIYITDDQKGLVYRESQYEMLGLVGLQIFDLNIPDYIAERIANTAPIDGNQKEEFDNIEINWSIDRKSGMGGDMFREISIYISLSLKD